MSSEGVAREEDGGEKQQVPPKKGEEEEEGEEGIEPVQGGREGGVNVGWRCAAARRGREGGRAKEEGGVPEGAEAGDEGEGEEVEGEFGQEKICEIFT